MRANENLNLAVLKKYDFHMGLAICNPKSFGLLTQSEFWGAWLSLFYCYLLVSNLKKEMVRFMEEEKDLKGIKFSPKQTYLSASSNINFKRNLSKIDLVTNPSSWIKKILDSILKSDKKSDDKSWEIGKQWTKKMQNWQTNIITFWFDEKIHGLCGSWQIEASLF